MEYTIQKLSKLAHISTRTLRYYDEIGLLKPQRINSSGYRIYGDSQVNTLQQILFYRELGIKLEDIKLIINDKNFNYEDALLKHHRDLLDKKAQLELLILNVEKTLKSFKGEYIMSDKEKFEAFKKEQIKANEDKYGTEIRSKFGDKVIDDSNKMFSNMSKEKYDEFQALSIELNEKLKLAFNEGDPSCPLAQEVASLHKKWLGYTWNFYTPEAHASLAESYVLDERFAEYYDKIAVGSGKFLRDAISIFTKVSL